MMKYIITIAAAAVTAVLAGPIATTAMGRDESFDAAIAAASPPLAKTWTTRGQEIEAGAQMFVTSALTSPTSFQATFRAEPKIG